MSDTAYLVGAELGVHDAAHLAGGPTRVVDAAVVGLVRSGRVRVSATGRLTAVAPARRDPVEAAVLDGIGTTGHRSADSVRWRLVADPRIAEVGRRLADRGLLRRRVLPTRRRGDAPSTVPTREGRRVLDALRARHAGDDVWRVALDGPAAARDERLRAAVVPPEPTVDVSRRAVRSARRLLPGSDPALAAHHTPLSASGGAGTLGFGPGSGADVTGGDGGS